MDLFKHSELAGRHATLSPSTPHWLGYDEDKMARVYTQQQAAARGDRLHALAASCIRDGVRLEDTSQTLNMYVNDAIRFRMTPEQPLFYSENWFGTADALKFTMSEMHLRVHDLKTGVTPAKVDQLLIYIALFCLEYGRAFKFKPMDLTLEARIYQNDDVQIFDVDPADILHVIDKGVRLERVIREMRKEMP